LGLVKPALQLVRESFPERPAFGTAVSRAILLRVAAGELPETARLGRPGRIVAFGRQDGASPGYAAAVAATRAAGFAAVERLAGGRAAIYHEGTLHISRAYADPRPGVSTRRRFEEMAELARAALAALGVDARIGEVPGEYCPGAFSVNARDSSKLVGIGQRVIAGGAHVGGVVVVSGARVIREVLGPVYAALELDWEPAAAGAVEDEVPGVGVDRVEQALLDRLAEGFELVEVGLDPDTLALAERLEPEHHPRLGADRRPRLE
jgi:octanoyl-[GcvH]:protein N-octanoyltransferase